MARNPKWTRDELILAPDLYMRVNPVHTSDENPEIIALSETLNSLPIHPHAEHGEKFRNANGVYMKLCNFLRLDPTYTGKGLQRGGKLEEASGTSLP
jgi:5-methylcytosine-specific restriction enzyme A